MHGGLESETGDASILSLGAGVALLLKRLKEPGHSIKYGVGHRSPAGRVYFNPPGG